MLLAQWIKPICTFNFFWKPSALSSYFVKERNEMENDNKMLTRQVSTYTVFVSLSPVWLSLKLEWKFGLILFNVAVLDPTGKNIWTEEFWKEKQNCTDLKKGNKSAIQLRGHGHHIEVLQGGLNKVIALIGNTGFSGGAASKESSCKAGVPGSIPGSGRSLEKGMATHCSVLAWRIPRADCVGKWVLQKCLEIYFLKWVFQLTFSDHPY